MKMDAYQIVQCPTNETSYVNRAVLNPAAKMAQFEHIAIRYPRMTEAYVFSVLKHEGVRSTEIAFNNPSRKWANLMLNKEIEAAPYEFNTQKQCLSSITFTVDLVPKSKWARNEQLDADDMALQFSQYFTNQAFTVGQLIAFLYNHSTKDGKTKEVTFSLTVKSLEAFDLATKSVGHQGLEIGLTTANTVVVFEPAEGSEIMLSSTKAGAVAQKLFNQNWDFETMGVGGLSKQFNIIFRRAFLSRLLPPKLAEDIGEEHTRGILLYGPPGTGKTLIARQIGKMLLAREPKIVSGPEIFDKYVGGSEANVRKLFADAEQEQAARGSNSALHVIIFDEIDSICKSRAASASSSGAADNVVNQLLSKIDGVNALNNVLLIGMTNRKDLIDEAILRPGRLELQIEIGLPTKEGRLEILKIHTRKLRDSGKLDKSVNLEDLAERTKNFTGAELAGLVRVARSYAISRITKADNPAEIDINMFEEMKVTAQDFLLGLENDIRPALGASEDQLKNLALPMVDWDPVISSMQSELCKVIERVSRPEVEATRPYIVLLQGEPGAGLTSMAANTAVRTRFPFIRVYQPIATEGETENSKIQYLKKLFDDASRSEFSCVVLDDLDIILDYSHFGPTYSKALLNFFVNKRNLVLPGGRQMLVLCTCSNQRSVKDLNLNRVFKKILRVPSVTTTSQINKVLSVIDDNPFDAQQAMSLCNQLGSMKFRMGIKKLNLLIQEILDYEPRTRVDKFIELMQEHELIVEMPIY